MQNAKITNTEKRFSRAAETYDNEAFVHEKVSNYLFSHANLPYIRGQVLDIGSGTGISSKKLLDQFNPQQITCLDLSFEMLLKARIKIPEANFIQADMGQIPFKSNFEVVVSSMSLQWLEKSDLIAKTISNCLTAKGTFACSIVLSGTFKIISEIRREILLQGHPELTTNDKEISSQSDNLPSFEELKIAFSNSGLTLRRSEKHVFYQYFDDPTHPFSAIKNLGIAGSSNLHLTKDEHRLLLKKYTERLTELKIQPNLDYIIGFFWGNKL